MDELIGRVDLVGTERANIQGQLAELIGRVDLGEKDRADIQRHVGGLIGRVDLGEKDRADSSSVTNALVASLTSLRVSSAETAQRVADLEQRFLSAIMELEARPPPPPIPESCSATKVDDVMAELERILTGDKPFGEHAENGARDQDDGTVALLDGSFPPAHDVAPGEQGTLDHRVRQFALEARIGEPKDERETPVRSEPSVSRFLHRRGAGRNLPRRIERGRKPQRGKRKPFAVDPSHIGRRSVSSGGKPAGRLLEKRAGTPSRFSLPRLRGRVGWGQVGGAAAPRANGPDRTGSQKRPKKSKPRKWKRRGYLVKRRWSPKWMEHIVEPGPAVRDRNTLGKAPGDPRAN